MRHAQWYRETTCGVCRRQNFSPMSFSGAVVYILRTFHAVALFPPDQYVDVQKNQGFFDGLFLFFYFNHCRNVRSSVGHTVNGAALKGNVAAHLMILSSSKPDFLDHVEVRKRIHLHSKF